jgi:AAA+ superfamily predicted ATPase
MVMATTSEETPVERPTPVALLNAQDLERELDWFTRLLDARFARYFRVDADPIEAGDVPPPDLTDSQSPYARLVRHYDLSVAERAAVVLALVPHIRPHLLDAFHTRNKTFDRAFTEFGGVRDANGDFLPTGETLVFILAGTDLRQRFALEALFRSDHFFAKHDILRLSVDGRERSPLKGVLQMSQDCLGHLTTGHVRRPDLGPDFPARLIETQLAWSDIVLHPGTLRQVQEIEVWLRHGDTLMQDWGMAPRLRPGYRALFYGPPGTGKTMTACLLGKSTGRDVYKVDLSLVVSKYIGETEKNLARVFDQAQSRHWILFFDEADALFGKRSDTRDAHDRYANQEVSFLLQRIEVFDGIAILATNQKDNLDRAFARRFESVVYFPMPRPEERLRLWRQGFSPKTRFDPSVDFDQIAAQHELCGGSIMNVVRYASLQALEEGDGMVTASMLQQGIHREHAKEGRAT